MKQSLTGRVGRIVSGSLNALVDAVENAVPETVMEEAIREIDGAIDEVRAELGRVAANKHLANARLMAENHKHGDLSEKIELAVREGRDDLAEAAIARQLDIEAQIPVLGATIADCAGQEQELEGYIHALQAKRREMRDELKQYRAARREAEAPAAAGAGVQAGGGAAGSVQARVAKAGSAFDRVLERTSGVGSASGSMTGADRLAELEDLAHHNRIQERLAAVKQKAGGN